MHFLGPVSRGEFMEPQFSHAPYPCPLGLDMAQSTVHSWDSLDLLNLIQGMEEADTLQEQRFPKEPQRQIFTFSEKSFLHLPGIWRNVH